MKNNFKTLKASIIMGILLVSVSATIVPTTSAGFFVNLSSYMQAAFDATNFSAKPVVPLGEIRSLTIYLTYGVNSGGLFKNMATLLFGLHRNRQVNIKLQLGDHSPWCTPTLFTDTITTTVDEAQQTGLQAILNLRVDDEAPAFGSGFINLKVTVPKVGMIAGYSNTFQLEFSPAYLPIIKPETPAGNYELIGPMDTASIPIEIENLGNAKTKVQCRVYSMSSSGDWGAIVTNEIYLDETAGSKGIVYLTVKPPKSFGYHDESVSISVEMIPIRAQGLEEGRPQYVDILIDSRGFSFIGFEIVVVPIIIIIAIIFFVYYFMFRKKGKM
jgi:hypothetical protein